MSITTSPQLPPVVAPHAVAPLIEQGTDVKLLDVRTPAEFEAATSCPSTARSCATV